MRRAAWSVIGTYSLVSAVLRNVATIAPGGPARARVPSADDGARVVGERRQGRVLDLTVRSPALGEDRRVRLLLPPGWARDAKRSWPALWLLHGPGGDHTSWTTHTDVMSRTEHDGFIVVLPEGGACAAYTDPLRPRRGGARWETFHLTELVQILERGYRAGPARAVAGCSQGGRGALAYAARHRGTFRAVAAFSAPVDTLHHSSSSLDGPDLMELSAAVARVDWSHVWGDPVEQRALWKRHNPYDLVTQLTGVRLYLACGTGMPGPLDPLPHTGPDPVETLVHTVNTLYAAKLQQLGVPATTRFHPGTHSWPYWSREFARALPVLREALVPPPESGARAA
ncbi:alpha/beta hydrolase family protein [Actinocorallia sp. A-T 12471]|uniref:alpha/beta hydrolase n=1 Tax=Actinocorallia sp. A-T 12471 TaxID=3089813 RepID=UPI0029CCF6BE|nr:alpha/beta hydrolase family protein [Actinocorallia sp. A-T 12471]MDX6739411.1 alpha/beta hydrolase family protein [Actinocorallia sp. A-T 12471]